MTRTLLLLLAALALCACAQEEQEDMTAIQWGRAATQQDAQAAPGAPTKIYSVQLVRIQLAAPRDLTLYLSGQTSYPDRQKQGKYVVSVGAAGQVLYNDNLFSSAVGTAMHWVADSLQVDAQMISQNSTSFQLRMSASAGFGRPTKSYVHAGSVGEFTFNGTSYPVGSNTLGNLPILTAGWARIGDGAVWKLPPFTQRVKVQTRAASAGSLAPATLRVAELFSSGARVFNDEPVPSDFFSISTDAYMLGLYNTAGNDQSRALITCECLM